MREEERIGVLSAPYMHRLPYLKAARRLSVHDHLRRPSQDLDPQIGLWCQHEGPVGESVG